MVYAVVCAGCGVLTLLYLVRCWAKYRQWDAMLRAIVAELARSGIRSTYGKLQSIYVLQEYCAERGDCWYKQYHWCLLLGSVFFGIAAFCAVLHWTWEWPFLLHLPLSVLGGLAALLGVGYLGYGVVREKILPLDDGKVEEE